MNPESRMAFGTCPVLVTACDQRVCRFRTLGVMRSRYSSCFRPECSPGRSARSESGDQAGWQFGGLAVEQDAQRALDGVVAGWPFAGQLDGVAAVADVPGPGRHG